MWWLRIRTFYNVLPNFLHKWSNSETHYRYIFLIQVWLLVLSSDSLLKGWWSTRCKFSSRCLAIFSKFSNIWCLIYFSIIYIQIYSSAGKDPPTMQETPVQFLCQEVPLERDRLPTPGFSGFPGDSDCKESSHNAGDLGSIPGFGRSHGEGNGNPLQYSCQDNLHGQRYLVGYSP